MNVVVAVAQFLVNEILSKPFYLVGLMTAVGLVALRRRLGEVVSGALKATMGFLILVVGANTVVSALTPLGTMILGAVGARGVVPTNEAIVALAQKNYGAIVAWVMITGFGISLLIARLTPLRYVFLTGHHVFFMATMLAVVLLSVNMPQVQAWIVGSLLLGTIMVIMPAFAQPWMRRVTGDQPVAIGHFGSLGYISAGIAGQLVGRRSESTENMRFPEGLRFLREPMIATALSMVVIYLIFAIAYLARAGQAAAIKVTGSPDWASYLMASILQALQFGVGVALILFGVRTILGEIVPAFAGIAERIVPGALPALDCPVSFPYAPNAVLVGFLASFLGGLLSLVAIAVAFHAWWGLALILPGMVPHFFTGGTAGVFGNATGGRRGAAVGGFVNGVLITFLPAFLLFVLGSLGFANTTFGDADFAWYGIVVGNVVRLGPAVGIAGLAVVLLVLIALASLFQKRFVESGWTPGKPAETPGEAPAMAKA